MKNIVVLVFVAALAYLGYKKYVNRDPAPVRIYKEIAEHWVRGEIDAIVPHCADDMTERAFRFRSVSYLTKPIEIGTIVDISFENVSVAQPDAANQHTVSASQILMFNPPEIDAQNYARWRAVFEHTVLLKEVAGEWKVTSFDVVKKEVGENRYKSKF